MDFFARNCAKNHEKLPFGKSAKQIKSINAIRNGENGFFETK
jgi:hypothetical protein